MWIRVLVACAFGVVLSIVAATVAVAVEDERFIAVFSIVSADQGRPLSSRVATSTSGPGLFLRPCDGSLTDKVLSSPFGVTGGTAVGVLRTKELLDADIVQSDGTIPPCAPLSLWSQMSGRTPVSTSPGDLL